MALHAELVRPEMMSLPKTADRKSIGVKTDDIKMKGNLLKLKTKKFKYFVLRDETDSTRARLEYYPDERTFLANQTPPRRSIILKDCLNMNKGEPILKSGKFSLDHYDLSKISSFTSDASPSGATNQGINVFKKYVLYIYTHKDVFKIGFPSEAEQEEWFFMMQQLRSRSIKKETITNEFEHVWPVKLVPQSYGCGRKMKSGFYHFCLNNKFVNLIRMTDKEEDSAIYSFALSEIKKIGDSHKYFIMIIGSGSALGEGALWFLVEDIQIAKNMHTIVYKDAPKFGPGSGQNPAFFSNPVESGPGRIWWPDLGPDLSVYQLLKML
ncbi:hypothetical protein HELRODRAFT_171842 [Helobdella robusta]|uniref:Insulin receptor substrate 1 n=1 Tax=Helobdella robusta TaxID=6412 RepID=T1F4S2_HELRO|nr:hypothetical protein HELRODRAFT_171842 [Helobdella robusta]ESO04841.1 hypothetical protein HELRODRAFT_171842 [Helobdella robusta]